MKRVIVCAANRDKNGTITLGIRHCDMFMHNTGRSMRDTEQGFVDQFGKWLTREEAWLVALDAGQIKHRVGSDGSRLFSENLY